jgi:hypothetical protein
MNGHYGYFERTEGKDGDQIDVFIKPDTISSSKVYIVDQVDPKTGKFDEHKVIMGTDSEEEARSLYLSNYTEGWQGLGAITEMSSDEFKDWLKDGKRTKKPVALLKKGKEILVSPIPESPHTFISDDGKAYTKVGNLWYDSNRKKVKNIKIKPASKQGIEESVVALDLGKKAIAKQKDAMQQLYAELGIKNRDEFIASRKISPERKAELLWLEVQDKPEANKRSRQKYIKETLGIDVGTEFLSDKPYLRSAPRQKIAPSILKYSPEQLKAIKGIMIKMPVFIADKEGTNEIDIDAYKAYMENAEQQETINKLLNCLAG